MTENPNREKQTPNKKDDLFTTLPSGKWVVIKGEDWIVIEPFTPKENKTPESGTQSKGEKKVYPWPEQESTAKSRKWSGLLSALGVSVGGACIYDFYKQHRVEIAEIVSQVPAGVLEFYETAIALIKFLIGLLRIIF